MGSLSAGIRADCFGEALWLSGEVTQVQSDVIRSICYEQHETDPFSIAS